MKRALIAATVYFLTLFALGFALGTLRVLFVAPRIGPMTATLAEIPVMLVAALLACRWSMRHWHVAYSAAARWVMVLWFLILLAGCETLFGAVLFGRTIAAQWATLATPPGLLGLSAQVIAALLPLFMRANGPITDIRR